MFSQAKRLSEMEKSFSTRLWAICSLATPLCFGFLLDMVVLMLNLVYAGHLNDKDAIAAVGLSQSFCYMAMVSFIAGISTSLDTLFSQEFGAGNYDNCAMYFNKMLVSTNALILMFYPLCYFSKTLLIFIGVDAHVAQISQTYLRMYFFSELLYAECMSLKIFLRSQRIAWPSFVASFITVAIYIPTAELLRHFTNMQLEIIPLTNFLGFLGQFIFLLLVSKYNKTVVPGTARCCRCSDFTNWGTFCGIALFTLALQIIDGWNSQIMTMIVATLDSTALAAQSIIFNINANIWIFTAFGISTSLSILVGNAMGSGQVQLAKKLSRQMLAIFFFFSVIVMLAFVIFGHSIMSLFTEDEAIVEEGLPAYYIMTFLIPLDTLNWIAIGILKGLGKLRFLPLLEIIFYYCLMQPICYYFTKIDHYSFDLYWVGLVSAVGLVAISNYIYIFTLSFKTIAQDIKSRNESSKLSSTMTLESELDEKLLNA